MLSIMTHERENRGVVEANLCARPARRLLGAAGLGAALAGLGWGSAAQAQVTRSFVATQSPSWNAAQNWSPSGIPTPFDRVRFGAGVGEGDRLVVLPDHADTSVKVILVEQITAIPARYRFDLAGGMLRATARNTPSTVVGTGGPARLGVLTLQNGTLSGGIVWVGVLGQGGLWVEGAHLLADEVIVGGGGGNAGLFSIDAGEVDVSAGSLSGDFMLANGTGAVNGGTLNVAGELLVGIDRTGRTRPSTFVVAPGAVATVGSMAVGAGSTAQTPVLVLDPALRGVAPALGVVDGLELAAGAAMNVGQRLIQRPGATLTLHAFAGVSPLGTIGGTAELAGTLVVTFAPGFDPPLDSVFPLIVTEHGVSGRWTVSYLPGLTGGRFLTIDYPPIGPAPGTVTLGVDDLDEILDFDDPEDGLSIPPGPTAAVIGDFNNDGKPDVAIAFADPDDPGAPGSVAILLNRGVSPQGWLGFESQITLTVIADPRSLAVADFDGDGNLDVVVAGYSSHAAQVIHNLGTSYDVGAPVHLVSGPVDVCTGDFNGDGRPDAVVALPDMESTLELRNQTRTFGLVPQDPHHVGLAVEAVNPFDPDSDKDSDVGGAGGSSSRGVSGRAFVTLNDGSGGFGEASVTSVGSDPVDVATGDFDGDGAPELVTVDKGSNTVSVLVNDGHGGFSQAFELPVGGEPRSITVADLDGDGDLDIAIVAQTAGGRAVQVIRNDTQSVGDLVFAPVSDRTAGPEPTIVLSADLNNDGRVDLLTINPSGPRSLDDGQVTVLLSKSRPRCKADFTRDGVVNHTDLDAFLAAWFQDLRLGTYLTDFNRDNVVNSTDVSDFISAYLETPASCRG
jgi:hypothetical protein